ncbi:DUF4124 domain-containing protein [Geomonas sp. Red32]|uniref:DUF4124 domain-containing protein n=1 Tax=Geomonas sp. Red32 TaxID=2912856 RepID=UPI00202CE455|nr:DUF4124 domain-containing protein [Geomonas sp. Red32]MCM0083416.1 DUF4124 domain-containing protein [Geomonas sp. Red32]
MKTLLLALLLIYPVSALAVTYEWTDNHGTVHFTDDRGEIPKKYRKKAKILGEDEVEAPSAPAGSPKNEKAGKKPAEGQGDAKEAAEKPNKKYGDKDEAGWRLAFQNANASIQRAEAELESLKARLTDTSNMSRGEYLSIQNSIKHTQSILDERKQKLRDLKNEADRAEVPASYRQ